jgi:hypothetical protein
MTQKGRGDAKQISWKGIGIGHGKLNHEKGVL